jgi:hypothetical protein
MVLLKPDSSEQVAVCAIYNKEINQIKSYVMQRHYTTHEQEVHQYVDILLLIKHVWTNLRMS